MKISQLSPERVFYYFSEICKIPHGSGNTQEMSQYLIDFAKEKKLEYKTDKAGNVAIYKDATCDRKGCEPIILQGHIDMVCAKADGVTKDMGKEGIEVLCDSEYVWANGTTLGADDGIGVAYMLAVLEATDISHPPVTALFTVDEETGMTGAAELDKSLLRGTRLINIDSEEEGVFTVSCAGGVRVICNVPIDTEETSDEMKALAIEVYGLKGGHSGIDIGRPHLNGISVLGEILNAIPCDFGISDIITGDKLNVIPQGACAKITVAPQMKESVRDAIHKAVRQLSGEAEETEPDFGVKVTGTAIGERCTTPEASRVITRILCEFPDGVQTMRDNMVESSLNMGMAVLGKAFTVGTMLRSNIEIEKSNMVNKIRGLIEGLGGTVVCEADYPSWEYRENSPLRETMVAVYSDMSGKAPKIESIHAGLECGLFAAQLPELDMVSFGPDLEGVHTPLERMSIASAKRCWEYLVALLGRL